MSFRWSFMSLHEVSCACMQFHYLSCSFMSLYVVSWACSSSFLCLSSSQEFRSACSHYYYYYSSKPYLPYYIVLKLCKDNKTIISWYLQFFLDLSLVCEIFVAKALEYQNPPFCLLWILQLWLTVPELQIFLILFSLGLLVVNSLLLHLFRTLLQLDNLIKYL